MTEVRRTRARGQLPTKAKVEYGSITRVGEDMVTVMVLGRPAPQGSKNPSMEESNPRTKPWRAAIKKVCDEHLPDGFEPFDGALGVEVWFWFDPPASAKPGELPTTKSTYDVDKLCRAIFDGLVEGGVVVDDARFVDATLRKRYVWDGTEPRAGVVVERLSPEHR